MAVNNAQVNDKSIASLSGSSQQALGANGNRIFMMIQNTGNAQAGVNLAGGTAAIGGTGTITLQPGGILLFDSTVPNRVVNVIGTNGQSMTVLEG